MVRKCPRCGGTKFEERYGIEVDPGDPSTIELEEMASKYGWDIQTFTCKNCGYQFEKGGPPGQRD